MFDSFTIMIKKRMIELGRDDFSKYLSEILGVTLQSASNKMCKHRFSLKDACVLTKALNLPAEELKAALLDEVKEAEGAA